MGNKINRLSKADKEYIKYLILLGRTYRAYRVEDSDSEYFDGLYFAAKHFIKKFIEIKTEAENE